MVTEPKRRRPKKPARRVPDPATDHRDKPLAVKISRGMLTIEIGVATCAFAALAAPFAWELANPGKPHDVEPQTKFKITSDGGFAVDVMRALTEEAAERAQEALADSRDAGMATLKRHSERIDKTLWDVGAELDKLLGGEA